MRWKFLLFEWGVGLAEVDVTLFPPFGREVTYKVAIPF
jgi:hypothetical protein